MSSKNKIAVNFFDLAKRSLMPAARVSLVVESNFDEKYAFHKMHIELQLRSDSRNAGLLQDYYPFLKLGGKWRVSTVRMYNYLKAAQKALSTFQDEHIQAVFDVVQAAKRYQKEYAELDKLLTVSGYNNYEEYQEKLKQVYISHMMTQKSIFDRIAA